MSAIIPCPCCDEPLEVTVDDAGNMPPKVGRAALASECIRVSLRKPDSNLKDHEIYSEWKPRKYEELKNR